MLSVLINILCRQLTSQEDDQEEDEPTSTYSVRDIRFSEWDNESPRYVQSVRLSFLLLDSLNCFCLSQGRHYNNALKLVPWDQSEKFQTVEKIGTTFNGLVQRTSRNDPELFTLVTISMPVAPP